MLLTSAGDPVAAVSHPPPGAGEACAIVPVLDEASRLAPCLDGLLASGPWLREILVVDGGSRDGTQAIVADYARRDARVRAIDAAPVGDGWNGKAWGLEAGLAQANPAARWIVTIDADVRPAPDLIASLLAHAHDSGLRAFSAAPLQHVAGAAQGVLHPALLATLVYRLGLPGNVATSAANVQANGQCFFAERELLQRTQAIAHAKASRCEDVTIARRLAAAGHPVGFFEAGTLARVAMYGDAGECWNNWPRSLALVESGGPDRAALLALVEVLLVQALPIPLALALAVAGKRESLAFRVNAAFALARLGVLAGARRAYGSVPATYWLSPFADVPAAYALLRSALRREHVWRGRTLVEAERKAG